MRRVELKWTDIENDDFIAMKKIVVHDVLLSYPNFSENITIHTDARKIQLGGVISQNRKTIIFYSFKLTPAKINYTTTERELLSIIRSS